MAKKLSRRDRRATQYNKSYEERNNLTLANIIPITENQKNTYRLYRQNKNLLLYGTAGTGKTFVSLYLALSEVLSGYSKYKKIIIVRSVVPTRDMGFLPGNSKDKSAVYEAPYNSILSELLGRSDAYTLLKSKGIVEFMTSSFVRGITLKDCIVIVDEFQNFAADEINSVITRVGNNCKLILCGDCKQNDLIREKSGFGKVVRILSSMASVGVIEFNVNDIVRSGFLREYIVHCEQYELCNS